MPQKKKIATKDTLDTFEAVLRTERLRRGWTLEKTAEFLGISGRHLWDLEHSRKKPSFGTLYHIIRSLGLDANSIFYPGINQESSPAEQVARLLYQCEVHEADTALALVEAFLSRIAK